MSTERRADTCGGGPGEVRHRDERGERQAGRLVHLRLRTVRHSPRLSAGLRLTQPHT